jgi:hypothetical protein
LEVIACSTFAYSIFISPSYMQGLFFYNVASQLFSVR